jgi:hypothetical protein
MAIDITNELEQATSESGSTGELSPLALAIPQYQTTNIYIPQDIEDQGEVSKFWNSLGAGFESTVGTTVRAPMTFLANSLVDQDPNYNPFKDPEILARGDEFVTHYADSLAKVKNAKHAQGMLSVIERYENLQLEMQKNNVGAVVGSIMGGLTDPTIAIPLVGMASRSIAIGAAKGAVIGGAYAGAYGLAEQTYNPLVTDEDVQTQALYGALLTSFLGGVGGALASPASDKTAKAISNLIESRTASKTPEALQKSAESIGAASNKAEFVIADSNRLFGFMRGALKWVTPQSRTLNSQSTTVRELGNKLSPNNYIFEDALKGISKEIDLPSLAESRYFVYKGKVDNALDTSYAQYRKSGGEMNQTQFFDAVRKHQGNVELSVDQHVIKVAKDLDMTIKNIAEELKAAKLLPKDARLNPLYQPQSLDHAAIMENAVDVMKDIEEQLIKSGQRLRTKGEPELPNTFTSDDVRDVYFDLVRKASNTSGKFKPTSYLAKNLRRRGYDFDNSFYAKWGRANYKHTLDKYFRDVSIQIESAKYFNERGSIVGRKAEIESRLDELPALIKELDNGVRLGTEDPMNVIPYIDEYKGLLDELEGMSETNYQTMIRELVDIDYKNIQNKLKQELDSGKLSSKDYNKAVAKLEKTMTEDKKDLVDMFEMLTGQFQERDPHWLRNISAGMGTFQTLRLMGMNVFAQIPDLARLPIVEKFQQSKAAKSILAFGEDTADNIKMLSKQEQKMLGFIIDHYDPHNRIYGQVDMMTSGRQTSFEELNSRIVGGFMTLNGVNSLNNISRSFVAETGALNIITLSKKLLNEAGGITSNELIRLKNLGVDRALAEKIVAQYEKHSFVKDGTRFANFQGWDDTDTFIKFGAMLRREVDNTIAAATIGSKPKWMSTAAGRLISQFMSFSFVSGSKILLPTLQGINGVDSDFSKKMIGRVFTDIALGVVSGYLRDLVGNGSIDTDPKLMLQYALERSSIMALLMVPNSYMNNFNFGLGAHLGTGFNARAQANRSAWGVFGPTAGWMGTTFLDKDSTLNRFRDGTVTTGDIGSLKRALPLQNFWLWNYALKELTRNDQ